MALDLLHQPTDRADHVRARARVHPGPATGPSSSTGFRRRRARKRGIARRRLRPDRGATVRMGNRMGRDHDPRDHRGRRGRPAPLSRRAVAAPGQGAAAAVRGLQGPELHVDDPRHARDGLRDRRRLPADDDLLPVRPWTERLRRGPGHRASAAGDDPDVGRRCGARESLREIHSDRWTQPVCDWDRLYRVDRAGRLESLELRAGPGDRRRRDGGDLDSRVQPCDP